MCAIEEYATIFFKSVCISALAAEDTVDTSASIVKKAATFSKIKGKQM